MRYRTRHPGGDRRRGVVLVTVLVVVVMLTLAAYQYSELMMAEYKAATSYQRAAQARALADSGVNYAAMLLSDKNAFANVLLSNPYDNPDVFREVRVSTTSRSNLQAYFSVIAPFGPDDTPTTEASFRYGVMDESGKINVNSLLKLDSSGSVAVQILTKLGLPDDTANSILDWIDADSTPRQGGAEDETYGPLGYRCKNGPLDTLEELLYVKGVTSDLLFGNDRNRNGLLDADEMSTGGQRDLGWQAYLTVYSREQNVDSDGNQRLYINTRNTLTLYSKLVDAIGQDMAHYLLAYRRAGPAPAQIPMGTRTQSAPASAIQREDLQLQLLNGGRNLSSLFELIGTKLLLQSGQPNQPSRLVECPLNDQAQARELLPKMLDKLSTISDQDLPARVNVNTAPRAVLLALPGLTEGDVETILGARPAPGSQTLADPIYQSPAWLYTEANLKPDVLRTLDRFITARTQVYRVQVMGHYANGGPSVRVEAIIDTNRGRPRIVYWRDLSELGKGFKLPMTGKMQ